MDRRPAPGKRNVGSRIFAAISGTGLGQRSRMAMTHIQHPKRQNLGWGRWGVREGGEGQGGGLCGRRNRIALPYASLQACCKAIGVHSQVQPRRCIKDPAWVEAGRPLSAVAPERQEVCRRSERVADRETEVTQRGGVGVEAQDFGAGRGALQREP